MIPAPKGALPAWPRQRGSPWPSDRAVDGLDRATHGHFAENPRILAKLTCSPPASSPCFVWRRPPRRAGRQALALPFSLHPRTAHRDVDRGPRQWRRWGRRRWTTRGGSNNCSPRADRRSSLLPAPASSSPRWGDRSPPSPSRSAAMPERAAPTGGHPEAGRPAAAGTSTKNVKSRI